MKSYKNVEMFAKNSPSGSYAAGCPQDMCNAEAERFERDHSGWVVCRCQQCERTY